MFDAVRIRLIEIGEAAKAIDPAVLARERDTPWIDVAGMRNHLAHRYFDAANAIVQATVDNDLAPLVAATERLLATSPTSLIASQIMADRAVLPDAV